MQAEIARLSLREQAETMDHWLEERLEQVLPDLMMEARVDMWILVGEEHHESPVLRTLLPANNRLFSNQRTIIALHRNQSGLVERLALSRFNYAPIYRNAWNPGTEGQWDCLRRMVAELDPQRIAINCSEDSPFAGDLTVGQQRQLLLALGPVYGARCVSADQLAINWLQVRSRSELEAYPQIVAMAKVIVAEVFSSRVVRVGVTTAQDLIWAFRQQAHDLGVRSWFHPFVTVWRQARKAPLDSVVLPGDVLHVDYGIEYLGLCTDHQQHAYVLAEGEDDAPEVLRQAMAQGNRLQQILLEEVRPELTGNQVLALARRRAELEGITMEISSHPLGNQGHGAGPLIGYWGQQQGIPGRGDLRILQNSCFAMELVVMSTAPDWDGRTIYMGMEEDIMVRDSSTGIIGEQQRSFLLIR